MAATLFGNPKRVMQMLWLTAGIMFFRRRHSLDEP